MLPLVIFRSIPSHPSKTVTQFIKLIVLPVLNSLPDNSGSLWKSRSHLSALEKKTYTKSMKTSYQSISFQHLPLHHPLAVLLKADTLTDGFYLVRPPLPPLAESRGRRDTLESGRLGDMEKSPTWITSTDWIVNLRSIERWLYQRSTVYQW